MRIAPRLKPFISFVFLLGPVLASGCWVPKDQSTVKSPSVQSPASMDSRLTTTKRDASDHFFESATIPRIVLKLADVQERKLSEDARQYVRCSLVEDGGEPLVDVGLKLKGAAGSFRELDDKPAFTINVNKFRKERSFHQLNKFHFNNSVQDELFTNEWLSASICRDIGIPAPRVTHARVWLNDRDLGLYVVKEGFDRQFLKRHFRDPDGNLYDGGFCQDIDAELEKDLGNGPSDLSDLRALNEACVEADPEKRWEQMAQLLDLDGFNALMAFEMMACHWDGYIAGRNNYRIYFPPDSRRAWFLPHGMDQVFQDPGFQTFGQTPAIVANSIRNNPQWNLQFRQRVAAILPLFEGERLTNRVKELHQKLRPAMMEWNPDGISEFDEQMAQLQNRLHDRYQNIAQQLTEPDPPMEPEQMELDPSMLDIGLGEVIAIADWEPFQESDAAQLVRIDPPQNDTDATDSEVTYSIAVGESNDCVASWRKSILLPTGHYRLTALLRVGEVVPRENDERGLGAGLRISGKNRENGLVNSCDWCEVSYDFIVAEEQQTVQLVIELRATNGTMAMKSAQLIRMEPGVR